MPTERNALESLTLTAADRARLIAAGRTLDKKTKAAAAAFDRAVSPAKRRYDAAMSKAQADYDSTVETILRDASSTSAPGSGSKGQS